MKRLAGLASVLALVFTVACAKTDAGITTNIKTKFATDDTVKAYQINVDTQDHVVTLTGDVSSAAAKERAMIIARETSGVNDVIDHMVVAETAPTSGVGADFKNDAEHTGEVIKDDAEKAGDAIKDGAEKTGNAVVKGVKKGAEAVKDGAVKAGSAVKHAVTDDDHDSNKDGR